MAELAITQPDLEAVATIYDNIRMIYKQKNPHIDSSLHEAFEKHVKLVMYELSQKVTDQPRAVVEVLVLVTKFKLFQLCSAKITAFVKMLSVDASGILADIFGRQEQMFAELTQRLIASGRKVSDLESQLSSAKREVEDVLSAAETLEKTLLATQEEKDDLSERLDQLRSDYEMQVAAAQEENKSLQERLTRTQKAPPTLMDAPIRALTPKRREGKSPLKAASPFLSHPTPKELTLRQLKDFIEELYISKPKYDQKFLEAHQPRETMEQHMMNVLNQKYGLKSLIAEWVTNVVKGIQRYSEEDNDVATFGKILKNEIEEEFRFVQKQVKSSVSELLKMRIKADFPYIQEKAAKELLTEKLNGDLEHDEWLYVINYMYNDTDRSYLQSILQNLLRAKEALTPRRYSLRSSKRQTPQSAKLSYQEFLKTLLDFQLEGHERFLSPFLSKFRSIDADSDGVLTTAQFRALLVDLNLALDVDRLVEQADPIDANNITFSDTIGLLSTVSHSHRKKSAARQTGK